MPRSILVVVALAGGVLAVADAQQRDAGTPGLVAIGAARVSGQVVTADSQHQPLRGAIVTLTGPAVSVARSSITNDDGRFVIDRLPAGRYTLVATKSPYLETAYGATRPGRQGVPLSVAGGQQMSGVVIAMPHGAAVSGTVTEADGQPATGAQVSVMQLPRIGASLTLTATAEFVAFTDDRGMFRIFGLAPGDYVVAAEPRGGRVGAVASLTNPEIDATFAALRQQRAGSSNADRPGVPAAPLPAPRPFGVSPTYFPGVSSAAEAQHITLGVGDDRSGVDITLRLVPMATIQGTVVAPDGAIPAVRFSVSSDAADTASMSAFYNAPTATGPGPDGTFTIRDVTPGRYSIIVRTTSGVTRGGGPPASDKPILFAAADVSVGGHDVTGLTLALQPAMRFAGKVAIDRTAPGAPLDLTNVTLRLTNLRAAISRSGLSLMTAAIRNDGTFEVPGLIPGTYEIGVQMPAGSTFWLRSAIAGGKDVIDTGLDVRAGSDVPDALITFSDRHAALSGTLHVPADQTASSYFIVVYPTDRSMWRVQARRVQMIRPGTDGRFISKDLPAGEYFVAALTDVEPDDLTDPSFFDALLGASVKVSMADGEQRVQDLRVGGAHPGLEQPRPLELE